MRKRKNKKMKKKKRKKKKNEGIHTHMCIYVCIHSMMGSGGCHYIIHTSRCCPEFLCIFFFFSTFASFLHCFGGSGSVLGSQWTNSRLEIMDSRKKQVWHETSVFAPHTNNVNLSDQFKLTMKLKLNKKTIDFKCWAKVLRNKSRASIHPRIFTYLNL